MKAAIDHTDIINAYGQCLPMGLESMQTHNPSGQRIPQVSAKFLLRECSKGEGRHALRVSSPATGLKVGGSSDKVTLSQPRDETGVQVSCSLLSLKAPDLGELPETFRT